MTSQKAEMIRSHAGLNVSVEERTDEPGVWTVEAIDFGSDGCIFQALFVGPKARDRAEEYAELKYGLKT